MRRYWRHGFVLFVSVVLASGFLASAAAASGGDVELGESDSILDADSGTVADTNKTAFDSANRSSAANNETLVVLAPAVGVGENGGRGELDCVGEALSGHECQKGGLIDLSALVVDYDGAMGGTITDLKYWFDDHFVVTVLDKELQVELGCEMGLDGVGCPSDVDVELIENATDSGTEE